MFEASVGRNRSEVQTGLQIPQWKTNKFTLNSAPERQKEGNKEGTKKGRDVGK